MNASSSLTAGLSLTAALGGTWIGVAMLYARASSHQVRPLAFYLSSALVATPLAWLTVADWRAFSQGWPPGTGTLAMLMAFVGAFNMGLQVLVLRTIAIGHPATVWTMTQSAMVIPFLTGIVLWREPLGWPIAVGVLLVLVGVALLGSQRSEGADGIGRDGWRWMALACFLGIGVVHVLNTIPSHAGFGQSAGMLRVPLSMSAYASVAVLTALMRRTRPHRYELLYGGAYGALSILSAWIMFKALDILSQHQRAGIVFPVAVGISILGFAVMSRKTGDARRTGRWRWGMACVLLGMASVAAAQFLARR